MGNVPINKGLGEFHCDTCVSLCGGAIVQECFLLQRYFMLQVDVVAHLPSTPLPHQEKLSPETREIYGHVHSYERRRCESKVGLYVNLLLYFYTRCASAIFDVDGYMLSFSLNQYDHNDERKISCKFHQNPR